jgi:pyruvate dehydrogenase E2 component (dihydrolipoamide acetyltransferase)
MPTPVVMPQMGESVAEGTIVRWMKKVGDPVDRDEPLFEISTDKVDAEIPAPAAGVLSEISVREGETVPVNTVVATIGQAGDEVTGQDGAGPPEARQAVPGADSSGEAAGGGATAAPAVDAALSRQEVDPDRRHRSSPLVRRLAKEHDVDLAQVIGSGIGGRVTKKDLLDYVESRRTRGPDLPETGLAESWRREARAGAVEVQPLSVMRRRIAEHMVLSRRTSAHVHSVFHVNFSTIDRIRQQKKADYERAGARLTYLTFIAKAVVDALRRHRIVNASLDGETVIYRKEVHLGVAVALESGLIVPVIRHADEKNLLGLSRAIADVAERARRRQLSPDEVRGGTFTITNPGQFGSQFGLPIINQPQVAILGVGAIEKRPIVVDDALAIRTMGYLTLGYDHRLVDGAVGDQFMADVQHQLEHFDIAHV